MSANRPLVPRIQSFYFSWGVDNMLVFPADKHRTYFAVEDDDQHDLMMWVGDDPPSNTDEWWSIANSHVFFEYGVHGPIYFQEPGGAGGDVKIISTLPEEPTEETAP